MRANAASRLLAVLEEMARQGSAGTTREVWARGLKVEPKDTLGVLVGIASVVTLLAEAREASHVPLIVHLVTSPGFIDFHRSCPNRS